MAGAYVSSGGGNKTAGSSHTESITVPSCDLFILGTFRTILDANTPAAPTSATLGGVAAVDVGPAPQGSQNSEWVKMYYYFTPPTGSKSIVVSGGGGTAIDTGFIWAAYTGFQQSGQPDATGFFNHAVTTAITLNETVVASNCWLIAMYANGGSTPSSFTNGTSRIFSVPNDGVGICDSNAVVGTGAQGITVNQASTSGNGLIASFVLAATSTVLPRSKALLGAGV